MANRQYGNEATMKRPSLAERMQQAVRPAPSSIPSAPALEPTPAPPAANDRADHPRAFYAATRAGKKKVTAAVTPDVHLRFRQLGLEAGKGNETLLIEAISDLFVKYGKPPIA
jgi:hypothetical protein